MRGREKMNKIECIKRESVSSSLKHTRVRREQVRLPSRLLKIYYNRARASWFTGEPARLTPDEGESSQAMKVFAHLSRWLCTPIPQFVVCVCACELFHSRRVYSHSSVSAHSTICVSLWRSAVAAPSARITFTTPTE